MQIKLLFEQTLLLNLKPCAGWGKCNDLGSDDIGDLKQRCKCHMAKKYDEEA